MATSTRPSPLGYSPQYPLIPFTDFESVTPETPLDSLNLSWREKDLPERVRTKHVHRLHPYLGKFVPQLVEIFLRKYRPAVVCDPFSGSGTTLVEAAALGIDAVGADISEFNTLMTKVKTAKYDVDQVEREVLDVLSKAIPEPQLVLLEPRATYDTNDYLASWYAPKALDTLLAYRAVIDGDSYVYSDLLKVILSRAARSARLTTHFDLDFPKRPQTESYYCYKHSRTCRPTENAAQFLKRYSRDAIKRIREFTGIRKEVNIEIVTGDARLIDFPEHDLVVTSPPYVGLIDYHEQHRYAYELLGLPWRREQEIGPASNGNSVRAQALYVDQMVESFSNVKRSLARRGRMVVVVNDKLALYDGIARKSGFRVEARLERHVNRRTGRRAGDFFESVLVWKPQP